MCTSFKTLKMFLLKKLPSTENLLNTLNSAQARALTVFCLFVFFVCLLFFFVFFFGGGRGGVCVWFFFFGGGWFFFTLMVYASDKATPVQCV